MYPASLSYQAITLTISKPSPLITFVKDRPGHDRRYAIDPTKITTELGWKPAENFESGIRKTIEWYLKNQKWFERVKSGAYREWTSKQYGGKW